MAGAAALLQHANPSATPAQLKTQLQAAALDEGPAGLDNTYGAGILRLPAIPGPPTDVTGVPYNQSVMVSWTPPTGAVSSYLVTADPDGATCSTTGAPRTRMVTGLANGTAYTFTVIATNAAGTGPASEASDPVTPIAKPDAPTGVAGVSQVASVSVSWTAPADNGSAITGYAVTAAPGGATCSTSGDLTCVVGGLTNGTPYTFTVTATNSNGTGPSSAPSAPVTPATVPDPPTGVTALAGYQSVSVAWSPPAFNGGAPITGYTVTAAPGGATCTTTTALRCGVGGLANGTEYSFTVTATNANGTSDPSELATATPAPLPGPPTNVTGVPGDRSVEVSWTPPPWGGTSSITTFTVTAAPGGTMCSSFFGDNNCIVYGLTNGVPYTFTVVANTAHGTGPASEPSDPVTPCVPPGPPLNVQAVGFDSSVVVTWDPPTEDGGSPIIGYEAYSDGGGYCDTTGETTCTVDGLVNGLEDYFFVVAINANGYGDLSDPAIATPRSGNSYVPLTPTRIFDTKAGIPSASTGLAPLHAMTFQVTGQYPGDPTRNVPANATAVTGVLSVSGCAAAGYLSLTPEPVDHPTTSNLNFPAKDSRAAGVTVTLGQAAH